MELLNEKELAQQEAAVKSWLNESSGTNDIQRELMKIAVHAAIKMLTPIERDMIVDRLIFNKKLRESASERRVNVSTVCRNYKRGLNNLKQLMEPCLPIIKRAAEMIDEY